MVRDAIKLESAMNDVPEPLKDIVERATKGLSLESALATIAQIKKLNITPKEPAPGIPGAAAGDGPEPSLGMFGPNYKPEWQRKLENRDVT